MASSNIKALIPGELQKVWKLVLDIENYGIFFGISEVKNCWENTRYITYNGWNMGKFGLMTN